MSTHVFFDCPSCGAALHRVRHSPFVDAHLFYCDSCACAAEIGFYDPNYQCIAEETPRGRVAGDEGWNPAFLRNIEAALKLCACGGHFLINGPRHCFSCGAVVKDAAGFDLEPGFDPNADDFGLSDIEIRAFMSRFIRSEDLWG